MKEFDLELAKKGAKVCTRDGRSVRILCFDASDREYPIIALGDEDGREFVYSYTNEGKFDKNMDKCKKDLMLVGEKHEGWVIVLRNIYTNSIKTMGCVYDTKEQALEIGKEMGGFINVTKIEWEE